eukprot:2014783-Rhodomonas_salina.1
MKSAMLTLGLGRVCVQEYRYLNQSGVYELLDTDGKPMCDESVCLSVCHFVSCVRVPERERVEFCGEQVASGS